MLFIMFLLSEEELISEALINSFKKSTEYINEKKRVINKLSAEFDTFLNDERRYFTIKAYFKDVQNFIKSLGYNPYKIGLSASYGMENDQQTFYKELSNNKKIRITVTNISTNPFAMKKENMKTNIQFL